MGFERIQKATRPPLDRQGCQQVEGVGFKVSDDGGANACNPGVHDHVHAASVQAGMTTVKRNRLLNFHRFHEFSAVDRFQGSSIGLNFVFKF